MSLGWPKTLISAVCRSLLSAAALIVLAEAAPQAAAPSAGANPRVQLEAGFEQAAREFDVPARLLQAISFAETRWHHALPQDQDLLGHGHQRSYGVMGLRDDDWFGRSLIEAARLIGETPEKLKLDARANIRGAAAYLSLLRSRNLSLLGVERSSLSSWATVVAQYSGIPGREESQTYVSDVFASLRNGVDLNGIFIAPASLRELPWGVYDLPVAQDDPLGGGEFPGSDWDASPNITPKGTNPTHIIIHTTQGSFAGAVSWLKNPKSQVSAHYVIRSRDGYIKQLVRERDRAWHARCWNRLGIGIEHEGFIDSPDYYTDPMYRQSAQLVQYLTRKHSITTDHLHIVGHDFWSKPYFKESELASLDCNDHTDPGRFWDWDFYLRLVSPPVP
jgi:hypothetical protein